MQRIQQLADETAKFSLKAIATACRLQFIRKVMPFTLHGIVAHDFQQVCDNSLQKFNFT